jgi:peptide/nickel transport system substrate-binding protein
MTRSGIVSLTGSPPIEKPTLSRRRLLGAGGALLLSNPSRRHVAGAQTPVATPLPPARLRVAVGDLPGSFDPVAARTLEHIWLSTLIYDSLARWNTEGEIVPALGLNWSITGYDRIIDLSIRPDAFFFGGKPLMADDVRWTLERLRNSEGTDDTWRLEHVWRIESLDPGTVRIILNAPDASLVSSLASPVLAVLPEAANLSQVQAGTGPYAINFHSSQLVTFHRNPFFWQMGRPNFQSLRVRQIPDDTERSTALVTGAVDLIPDAPLLDIPMLEAEPSVRLVGGPSNRLCLLHMNLDSPVLRDVRVRRLLSSAIDRQRLVQVATAGQAVGTGLLIPEDSWAHGEVEETPHRAPEDIRAALAELGIGSDLPLRLITNNADATLANAAVVLQEQLAYCGIALSVNLLEDEDLERAVNLGDYDLLAGYTRPWRDPHELVRPLLVSDGSGNYSGYASPEVDGLIRGATLVSDREIRQDSYTRLEEQVQVDVPVIVLFRPHYFDAMTQRLDGYALLPPVTSRGLLPATLWPADNA